MRSFNFFVALIIGGLILLQLIPKAHNNTGNRSENNSLEAFHRLPESVKSILQKSCYDCHSNTTNYPWYTNIQPLSIWINHHIEEGKEELNFSEFGTYATRRKHHKLEEIIEQIEENEMPLTSYTLIHHNAKLSAKDKEIVISWAKALKDSIEHVYPVDSLAIKKRD